MVSHKLLNSYHGHFSFCQPFISRSGLARGGAAKNARMLVRKCRLIDDFARALDVVLFPWTLTAHAASIKHLCPAHIRCPR